MSKVIRYLPELQDDEQLLVASIFRDMTEEQAENFARVYRQRRRDANIVLVTALVGLFGIAGVQRFYVGQTGMGLLYLFTMGLCFIGTIVDVFKYKDIAWRFNEKQAFDVATLIRGAFPAPAKQIEEAPSRRADD